MKRNAYPVTSRPVSIALCFFSLATLLVFGGSPLPSAYGAQSKGAPSATTTFQRLEQPKLVAQMGHGNVVNSVAFSPDGRFVLTGSNDGTARLWVTATGREIRRFDGHSESVTSAAFSPDGRFVLTGGWDNTARLWDTTTGKEVRRFEGHSQWVKSVAFSPDGRFVLTGSDDGSARLWDVSIGKEVRRIEGHSGRIESVALSPDGRFVLTGSDDGTARLWDAATGEEVRRLKGHSGEIITSVAFSHDGRFVLTGCTEGTNGTGCLWDAATGRQIRRFRGHSDSVTSVAFSPDGRFVLTSSKDDTTRLWDAATGREIRRFEGHGETITSVAFSPDGELALTGNWYNTASLWRISTGAEIRRFEGHSGNITSVSFSPDGRFVLTGGWDNKAHLWDTTTGREIRQFEGHSEWVTAGSFSPDGRFILTGSWDKTARLWNAATGREVLRFKGHMNVVSSVAFEPHGRYVLTGGGDDKVLMWDAATGKKVRQFNIRSGADNPVIFSPDGRFVLAGSRSITDGQHYIARLWDALTGKEVRQFKGHSSDISSVAFSPDGRFALTSSLDGTARLWDAVTGKEVRRFDGRSGPLSSASFSPDGRFVLTGGGDNTARHWDVATSKEIRRFEGHPGSISSVVFSPDGRLVVTGSDDSSTRLWEAATGKELASLISFRDGTWAVVTADGRFDTNNLEEIKGLHWVMPDDPMRALPVEIFMRDYYEPQLLPKVLSGKRFKAVRPLAELNRVQPGVNIVKVEQGASPDLAKVTVEVSAAEGTFQRNGKDVVMRTEVHDLRLYRNGQLVGQWPEAGELTYKSLNTTSEEELEAWRKATEIKLDKSGKATKTFTVRLPRREDLKEVNFTAYAFNLDRVKSETARQTYKVPVMLKSVKGRAYLITVGVSGNEDMAWRLSFASEDAELIQRTLVKRLDVSKRYEKVVPVCLITTPPGSGDPEAQAECRELIRPTKENIKTVLDILAGREVERPRMEQLPEKLRSELRRVQPEDLVLLSFSSHGVTDKGGEFYLLPYDLGMESAGEVIPELLKRSISSQELSLWLGPVDAEQMVMVVDACHSAAAVEAEGFKPGPMGNPGLGQLSYDKGMPILVASQASESAWAEGGYSLLTLALAKEGIGEKQLGLNEALKYAEQRVSKLYEEKMGKEETKKIQVPKLFEFKR